MENSSRITLHNRARFYCKKKLTGLPNSFEAWQVRVYSYFFSRLLNQIEQFTESDFQDNSDSETVTYFVLMSDTVKDDLSQWSTFWFKSLIMYYSTHFPVQSIANELQALGLKRLFNLNPMSREASYEVDIELMDEMFGGDDTYWISEALDWFIYAEGNGYPEVGGDVIEEILAKIL